MASAFMWILTACSTKASPWQGIFIHTRNSYLQEVPVLRNIFQARNRSLSLDLQYGGCHGTIRRGRHLPPHFGSDDGAAA